MTELGRCRGDSSGTRNNSAEEGCKSSSRMLLSAEGLSPKYAEQTPNFMIDVNAGIGKRLLVYRYF